MGRASQRSICWGLCILLGALVSSAQAQSFTDVTATWGAGFTGSGTGSAWADYDGDGDLDLYAVFSGGETNILYTNTGSAFTVSGEAEQTGSNDNGATWGDHDGDGDLDLFTTDAAGNDFLYDNDGAGSFTDVAATAGVQTGGDYSPGWVDYDRDGDLDLYVAVYGGANLLFQNDGSGSFVDVAAAAGIDDSGNSEGTAWGDYNNDGWPDLYIADNSAANVIYENDGDGTFTDVTSTATIGAGVNAIGGAWGDYNNDGWLDLHVVFNSVTPDALYKNNGDGTFSNDAVGASVANATAAVSSVWADFDLDGDLDLHVNVSGAANLLYSNDGDGTFTDVAGTAGVDDAGTGRSSTWADIDDDGDVDLFVVNNASTNKLFENISTAGKSWVKLDLTGDGNNTSAIGAVAVAWTGGSSQRQQVEGISSWNSQNSPERIFGFGSATTIDSVIVRWSSGQVSASFTPAVSATLSLTEPVLTVFSSVATAAGVNDSGNHWRGGVWADYDNDGDEDLYLFTDNSTANKLYKNNGNSTFTNIGGTTANSGDNGGAVWGDYDADGDLDLYVTTNGAANLLYRYDGSDIFVDDATNSGTGSTGASSTAAWMDYDNDGDLDLFVSASAEANLLYNNNGAGIFTDVATTALVTDASGQARGVAWGDYDDDGDQDLYIANQSAANKLYSNNGNGTFADVGGTTADASNSLSPVWVDFDNDNDLDLFVYNGATDNRLYRNDGGGTFVDVAVAARIAPTATGGQGVWADYDNDGDLDLYVATSAPNNLFLNNGNGAFDEVGHAAGVAGVGSGLGASWGDYDGNGFLDLFVANLSGTQNLLFDNQTNTNKWLHVELEGLGSDSYGYGATIWATEAAAVQRRDIDGGSGYLAHDSPTAEFGFGNLGSTVDEIKVIWSSGFSNVLTSVATDQAILVTERAVVSQTPHAGDVNASVSANVTAAFSAAVTAVNLNTFVVHGSQSGELGGAYSGEGTDNISFNPTNDLLPGEEVEVRFADGTSAGLLSYRGTPVKSYVYRYTVAAGTGPAEFTSVFSAPFSAATHAVDLGDVDADGDLDLVAGNYAQQNKVYLNDGSGAMTGGPNLFGTGSDNALSVDMGDLDGDGDLDIITGNFSTQNTSHLNDGSGGFASSANFGTSSDATRPVVLGDLDGDGYMDVAVGNDGAQNVVYFNDGAGALDDGSENFGTGTDATKGLGIGDVDKDGDLDLFLGNHSEANKIALNDGWGGFTTGNTFGTGSDQSHWLAVGDVDGDGDVDVVNASLGGQSRPEINDGTGTFSAGTAFGATANARGIGLGDVDGDGDFDVAVGYDSGTTSSIYLNNGSGVFSAGTKTFAGSSTQTMQVALGDIDGDGDLDIVAGNNGTNSEVHFNSNAPVVNSTSPTAAFANAPSTGNVTATFSISVTAGDAASFVVHASMTGKKAGAYSGNNSTTLTFNPSADFFPGETVFSTLTTNVQSASGAKLAKGYVWGFTVDAAVGPAVFNNSSSDVDTPTNSSRAVPLGDVDGDGDLDMVVGNEGQANRVHLSNGDGTFASGSDVDTPTNDTRDATLGDVDGDGDLDLVTGNYAQVNRVYLGNGNGTFASGSDIDTPTNNTQSVKLGDVDGDGDLDLIAANANQVNRVYLGNGNGTFASGSDVDTPTNATLSVSLGDVDGDGDLDLVAGNNNQVNRVYLGNGNGTFASGSDVDTPTNGTNSVALEDLDGDGDLDLVAGNNSQANRVYLGNGDGTFASGSDVDTPANNTRSVVLGDLDGDGDLDLVAGNYTQVNRVYIGNGNGTFASGSDVDTPTNNTQSISLGDLDGDGDLDIATANYTQVNRVYLNSTASPAPTVSSTSPTAAFASAPSTGNVTATFSIAVTGGDAASFVVHSSMRGKKAGAYSGNNSTTLTFNPSADFFPGETVFSTLVSTIQDGSGNSLNKGYVWGFAVDAAVGPGNFTAVFSNFGSASGADSKALAVGDIDGDGDVDAVIAHRSGQQNAAYLNNGTGSLTAGVQIYGTGADNSEAIALGDIDGDGDLDVALGNTSQQNAAYLNNGSGSFSAGSANFGSGSDATKAVALGDVDGDGDLDLAAGNESAQNVVYLNNGSGSFSGGTTNFGTGSDATFSLAFGDVDNDGDLDIAAGNHNSQQNVAYINDGSGGFGTSQNFGTGSDNTVSVALGDIDGDGDLDVAVGNNSNSQNTAYLNNGSGVFSGGQNFGTGSDWTEGVVLSDVDGDSDLDVVAANYGQQDAAYLNNGSGSFSAGTRNLGAASANSSFAVAGDVDGDGDIDIFTTVNNANDVLYFNAAAPTVSSTSPTAAFASAPSTGNVTATFSEAVTAADAATFVVFGAMSGTRAGAYSGNNTTTLTFNPTNDFFPGETVFSTLTTTIQNASGDKVAKSYVWGFTVETAVGPGSFTSVFSNFGTGSDATAGVDLGDVDGDGDLDIALANQGEQSLVQLNNGSGSFSAGLRYFGGASDPKRKVEFVDLDIDGDLDIAAAHRPGQNVVHLNDGSGNFTTSSNFGTGSDDTYSIAFADFSGDGYIDAAVGNQAEQNVVYLNNGSGALTGSTANFGPGSDATYAVRVADVDNDGDIDVAVGNNGAQNVVYLNDGAAGFGSTANFGTGSDATHWVDFADADGDGDVDLAVGNYGAQDAVYLNDGAGAFTAGTKNFGSGSDNTEYVVFVDAEGDGDLDVAAGHWGAVDVVYTNDGSGNFTTGSNIGSGSGNTWVIAPGDTDLDGDMDLAVGITGQNAVYLNSVIPIVSSTSPTAAFASAPSTTNVTATFSTAVTGGDAASFVVYSSMRGKKAGAYSGNNSTTLTFDPSSDFFPGETVFSTLVSTIRDGSNNSLSSGRVWSFAVAAVVSPGNFTAVFSNAGSSSTATRSAALGDVDGDGDLDLGVAHLSKQNYVRLNDGSGDVDASTRSFGTGSDATLAVVFADIDGDGDLDVAAGNSGGQNAAYLNDGLGNFNAGTKNFGTGSDATRDDALAFGDIDGDGDLDAVVGNTAEQNVAYFNDGSANFSGASNFGSGSDTSWGTRLGDIDGDGDLDVAVGNFGSGSGEQNVVYLNDGTGNFNAGTKNFGVSTDKTTSVYFGDVDGDGDLDIAAGNFAQQSAAYLNDGSGNLTGGSRNFGGGSDETARVSLDDVDGDGDLDALAVIAGSGGQNAAYLNDGSGNFTAGTNNFGTGSDKTNGLAVGDLDGDGDLEIVAANEDEQDIVYFNAEVLFEEVASTVGVGSTAKEMGVSVGDLDGDGDLDMFVPASTSADQFYQNNGSGSFSEVASAKSMAAAGDSRGAASADYDNDGDLDVYVTRVGAANFLYQNNGSGAFTDVASAAGVADGTTSGQGASWADYDNDGDLDLYLNNTSITANRLFQNNGSGSFTDVAGTAGVANASSDQMGSWADYDNDGDLDLYVTDNAGGGANFLYQNDGNGSSFTDVSSGALVNHTGASGGIVWTDYDNDGDFDLFTAVSGASDRLYRNDGGSFTDVSAAAGVDDTGGGNSVSAGDIDNDGDEDLVVSRVSAATNLLYLNNGDGTYTENAAGLGITGSGNGRGTAFADFDSDGDLDLYVSMYSGANQYYRNKGNGNKWLHVKLTGNGSETNKSAIGVKVEAEVSSNSQWRIVDGGSGQYSQGSQQVEFGIGSAANVDKLTVTWSDGSTTVQNNVASNQTVDITEGGGGGGGGLSGGNGPGGVGKADGSTALAIWLKADANTSTTTDAAAVSSWSDASSSNNGFTQGTGSAQPLYKTNVLNGQPVLRFDGSDDLMTTSGTLALFGSNTSPLTVITVFDTDNNEGQKFLLNHATGSNSTGNFELGYDTGAGTGSGNFGLHEGSANATIVPSGTIASNTFNIMSLGVGSGSSPGNVAIHQNGSTLSSSDDNSGWLNSGSYPTGSDNISLGARIAADNGTTDSFHAGDIAEIIVVKDKLEDVQRILVENYLSAKYAIALGANDLYVGDDNGNGDYDHDVFGMGKTGGIVHMQGEAGGLKLFDSGFLSDDGDWMLAGHASPATVAWVNTDLGSVSANERWNRLWYIDRADAGSNGGNVRISFNYTDVGLGSPAGATSNYALLNRAGQTGDFLEISGTSISFNGNIVEVELDATNIGDGYYTLGYNNSGGSSVVVFSDAATAAGVQGSDGTRGVAWGDYDNDGDDDLYATNNGANRLYRNDGSGVFSEVGSAAGVADAGDGLSSVWGDYDGDSDLDLYVANNGANRLYQNDGSGAFAEVASSAGVADANTANAASWVDYDLDGDLDLYATNSNAANALYQNDGSGVFSSQTNAAADAGNGVGAAWGDYDNDGDPDLYLVNGGTANRLLRNDGSGTFVDQGGPTADTGNGQGAAWGDFDSDGDLDLYVTNSGGSNRLYRNDSASFTDIAGTSGLASSGGNGFAWGDYDADGDLDLYITLLGAANKFYQNNGGGSFAEIGSTAAVADAGNSRGVAWSDYDADGDLDFYVGNGSPNLLYKNNGNSNNRLVIGLGRTRGDATGIGTLVEVWVGGQGSQQIVDGGSGLYSQNSARLFFGLGAATQADSVVVNWPQGQRQVLGAQSANAVLALVEPLGESLSARGQGGTHVVAPSASKQIFHIGVVGDGSTTVDSLALTLSDLSTPTGITASDISALCVYSSSDTLFDQGDTQLAIQSAVNIGSETKLGFTPDTVPSATERFYIAVAKIAANPTDGHAFRTSFASGGLHTSGGYIGTAVAASDANNVTIDVTATKLAFATQPSGSVSGSALTTQPVVQAQDANGNLDKDFVSVVTLTTTAGGTLSNATATAVAGVATFSGLAYTATADGQSVALTADDPAGSSPDLTAATATAFQSDVVATQLVFTTQPVGAVHATALTTQPIVQAQNASGLLDTSATGTITLTPSAGSASGNTATMTAGVATFSGLALNSISSGVTLAAASSTSGIASATSNSIAVAIAPVAFTVAPTELTKIYDGQPKPVSATTSPSGVSYSVAYNGSATAPSDPGTYSVVFASTDANYTGSHSVSLTITGPDAPVAKLAATPTTGPVPLTVQFTSTSTGTFSGSTLATGQDGGQLGGFSSGAVTYTKPGTYTAVLTVSGPGGSSQASATVTVLGPPKLGVISAVTAKEDDVLTLNLSGKDSDAGTWSVSGLDNALIASAAVGAEAIAFTPVKDRFGSDVVTVTRTSALGLKTSQDVRLTWTPVDDPPVFVALPTTASAKEDSAILLGGPAFVKDIDSDVKTFVWSASGHQAAIVASASGGTNGVHFAPVKNVFGQSKTTLKVKDPVANLEISQEVVLTWVPVNDPPEKPRIAKPANNARDVPLATVLSWTAVDIDKDPLKFDVFFARVGQAPKQVAKDQTGTGYSALGLEPGSEYEWRVVARDPSGATADTVARFTTEADKLPPRIGMLSATPVADGVRIVWDTDEPAAFALDYRSAPEIATDTVDIGNLVDTLRTRKFEVALLALQPATWYDFSVRVRDRFQNESQPATGRFRTLAAPDTVKPIITPGSVAVNGITEQGVWIRWLTDELSTGVVTYEELGAAAKLAQATDGASSGVVREQALSRDHAIELVGLKANTRYRFVAESVDASGNSSPAVEDVFETAAEADIVAPKFTLGPGARAPKVESVDIELEADEVVQVEVRYDIDDTPEDGRVASGGDPATGHQVRLDGLLAGTTYSFQVEIVDVGGNNTLSDILSFETRAAPDTTAPKAEGWRVVPSAERALLDFAFDEAVTARVSWWPLADVRKVFFSDIVEADQRHKLALGNLEAATDYAYEVVAADEEGNASAPIADGFTTKAAPDTLPPVILNALVNAKRLESTVLLVDLNEVATIKGGMTLKSLPDKVEAGGTKVGDRRSVRQPSLLEKHRIPLTKLVPGAVYSVDFEVADPYGNRSAGLIEFKAPLRPDVEPPQLTQLPSVLSVNEAGARIGVAYNEDVQLKVRYAPAADASIAETRNFTQPQQKHAFELNGLKSGVEYTVALEALDAANLSNKQSLNFTTLAARDTIAPVFTKLPWVEDAQLTSVRLRLETDEPVVAALQLTDVADANRVFSTSVVERAKSHALEVTGLDTGAVYNYLLRVADANRNDTTATGQVRTIDKVVPPRIVEGPTRQRIGFDRAWLKLATNVPTRVVVDYFLASSPSDVQIDKPSGRGKAHVVQLTNLLPDTTYSYSVVAVDDKAKLVSPAVAGSFRTAKGPDIVAPKIQGAPSVASIADTRAKIIWKTDEPSDSFVDVTGPQGKRTFSNPDPTLAHEVELTNLQADAPHSYIVRSRDLAGNKTSSSSFSFTTLAAPDTLPPQFARRPIVRSLAHDNAVIAYSANEPSSSTVDIGTSAAYELGTRAIADQVLNHEVRIDGLAAGTEYHLRVGLTDAQGNGPAYFPDLVVTTDAAPDTLAPEILTGPFAPPPTESQAIVEWTTDEPATRSVRYWKKDAPNDVFFSEEGALALTHRLVLSNLEAGTMYEYIAASSDEARNGPTESEVGEFRTQSRPQKPIFTGGPVAEADEASATVTWTTNVPSNSIVDLGEDTQYGVHVEQADLVQDHEVVIKNLKAGVLYHYKVTSIDLAGNVLSTDPSGLELHSGDLTVRTLGQADTEAPRLVAEPTTVWTDKSVVVSWETDEASTSRIEWEVIGQSSGNDPTTGFVEDNQLLFAHSLTLTGLKPRTLYAVKVVSEDAAGNQMVWQPTAAAKAAAKMAFGRGLRTFASGKVAQPPGGAGTFVTDSFPDTRLPVITGGPRVREKSAESVTIEWQTDELSDSFVRFGEQEVSLQEVVGEPQDVQIHSVTLTNLAPGTSYYFQVESTDPSGNGASKSGIAVATTAAGADLAPPRYVREPQVVATTDVQATLAWTSDEAASAKVEYRADGIDVAVRQVRERLSQQQVSLTNLLPNTEYRALITLRDANRNTTEVPFELSFVTDAEPDLTPPRFLSEPRIKVLGDQSATIVWETDELASSFVDFDLSPYLGQVVGDPTYTTQHEIRLTNLEPDSTYFFRAGSVDRAQNGPIESPVSSFRTLAEPDIEPPAVPSALRATAGPGAVYLQWDAVAASDLGGYTVYREDLRRRFVAVATGLTEPSYLDVGLTNTRTYRYRVSASDAQTPANESASSTVITARPSEGAIGQAPQIVGLEQGAEAGKPVVMIGNAVPLDIAAELSYTVQVSTREDFSTMVDRGGNIIESPSGTTRWRLTRSLDPQTSYWFRARVFDGLFEGPWSAAQQLRAVDAATATNSEDFDGDGTVGFRDFFIMANGFGSTDAVLDLDQGGSVGGEDFDRFKKSFGEVMPAKRLETQRVAVAQGSRVEVEAEAISSNRVIVRLKLDGVKDLSGYGFSIAADPPILRYIGRADSAVFGGRGASLELAHDGSVLAVGEHLRGRQASLDMSDGWEIALLFAMDGAPRNVDLRVEEGFLGTGRGRMLRVEQEGSVRIVPQVYALYANYPNPFNPSTTIPLAIPQWASGLRRQKASLTLYNALGQVVRSWNLDGWSPGFHALQWDGRDARGNAVASGVYLMRLRAGDFVQVRKALLLR